jgi:hypothetical protein
MNLFNDHLNLSNNIYDNAKILKSVELNKQQELVNRNPTTKYYQTLALNLEEQVQYLKRQLNEFVGGPEPQLPTEQQPFQVPKEFPSYHSAEEDFVNQERDPMNYPPTLKQWLNTYPNPGKNHPNYQYWLLMYQTAQRYYARNRQVRESVQYLKRQLNEYASPPTINPLDQSYPTEDGQGATDVSGNPFSGPIYNFPPPPVPGQSSGGMRDFFPSGLSRTVGPNPSDYPGGDRNKQYLIDMRRYQLACYAYDRLYGKPRLQGGDPVSQFVRKVRRFLHTPGQ